MPFVRHVKLNLGLVLASISCAQVTVHSDDSGGFSSGVPFKEWLRSVEIEVPEPEGPFGNPLQVSGGNCSGIRITRLEATDLTETILSPAFGLQVSADLQCLVLASGGTLAISFAVENATADLGFTVQPVKPAGSELAVPLGQVRVTRCSVTVTMRKLRFTGTSFIESALSQFGPSLEQFVNQELPSLACAQLQPQLEKQATAALASILLQVTPLLQGKPDLPPEPRPVGRLVDWGTYPPARLLRALLRREPGRVASIITKLSFQNVPLHYLHVNRTVTADALGTSLRSYLEELRIEGLDTYVEGSLALHGSGHNLTSSAAFRNLRFRARMQAQVHSMDPTLMKQAVPLLENFEVHLNLGPITATAEFLAMISQEALDAMEVDQFQEFECLVACARDAAVGPEAPLALRRLEILNMSVPTTRIVAAGSLETGIADVMTTILRSTMKGYEPSLELIIQSSVTLLHQAMNEVVVQTLATFPPCGRSGVYFGPEGRVNLSLLLLSFLLAVLGGIVAARGHLSEGAESPSGKMVSLAAHPAVPPGLSRAYPFFVVSTMVLFLFSDLGLGTVVNIVFRAGDDTTTIGPAFSFSVMTLSRDSIRGGAFLIAILIVGLSGVWPFVKLGMLLFAWLAPPSRLGMQRRSRLLQFLDEYGKYSLVDSWLAILALCAFDIKWFSQEASVNVTPVPKLPFFTFVVASVLSLVLGHIATEFNRRCLDDSMLTKSFSRSQMTNVDHRALVQDLPLGQAILLLGLTVFTGVSLVVGACVISLQYQISGAIADLLLREEEKELSYSLVSLGLFLTKGFEESGGLHAVQLVFFLFALVIPLVLVIALLALLLMPMEQHSRVLLLKGCHILDAWAAFDVFVIAVVVANFEFWLLTEFLIYHDNIADACNWVQDNMNVECLAMQCHIQSGFTILALAGVCSYATPKLVFRLCQGVHSEAAESSDSEDQPLYR